MINVRFLVFPCPFNQFIFLHYIYIYVYALEDRSKSSKLYTERRAITEHFSCINTLLLIKKE